MVDKNTPVEDHYAPIHSLKDKKDDKKATLVSSSPPPKSTVNNLGWKAVPVPRSPTKTTNGEDSYAVVRVIKNPPAKKQEDLYGVPTNISQLSNSPTQQPQSDRSQLSASSPQPVRSESSAPTRPESLYGTPLIITDKTSTPPSTPPSTRKPLSTSGDTPIRSKESKQSESLYGTPQIIANQPEASIPPSSSPGDRTMVTSASDRGPSKKRKKRVHYKDFRVLAQIARNRMGGMIYLADWIKYSTTMLLMELKDVPSDVSPLEKQIKNTRQYSWHPNLLRLYAVVESKGASLPNQMPVPPVLLVHEFFSTRTLRAVLDEQQINERQKVTILTGVATGLCHLHNCKLVHQDLSSESVLVDTEFNVKLSDYMFTDVMESCLPESYRPMFDKRREIRIKNPHLNGAWSRRSDVFVLGLLILEVFNSQLDFPPTAFDESLLRNVPEELQRITSLSLHADPNERPTSTRMVDVLEDYLFSKWTPRDRKSDSADEMLREGKDRQIQEKDARIQELLEKLRNEERRPSTASPAPVTPRMSLVRPASFSEPVEDNISAGFGGQIALPWTEFAELLQFNLGASYEEVAILKYLLGGGNPVMKDHWEHLVKWFTPLYHSEAAIDPNINSAFTLRDIIGVVQPLWFCGFLNPVETNKILLKEPTGTFLFRFSTVFRCYTLSVSNHGQVGHWRIRMEKGPDWIAFYIDEKRYHSLHHIIETHLIEQLKINTDRSNQQPLRLEVPWERKADEGLYSDFP
eukprot:TRINITY_DN4752_c0_g1_i3.p1 TRINITY_DN4752_c0_g1~~TRINITY_DN4752_c0_g1_i3.p1  ORF type:complete len:746 (+),score=197.18 TRINITY_DN4752_c0_g1_i3:36-2273(+)